MDVLHKYSWDKEMRNRRMMHKRRDAPLIDDNALFHFSTTFKMRPRLPCSTLTVGVRGMSRLVLAMLLGPRHDVDNVLLFEKELDGIVRRK